MTPIAFVVAAMVGAVGRHTVGTFVCTWQALLVVNTVGAATLGWLVSHDVSTATLTVAGVGFCGALTTFSSFALEAQRLGWKYGSAFVASTMVCVTAAARLATTL